MQVTKIMEGQGAPVVSVAGFFADTLQREFDYYMAQKLLKSLLDAGLISEDEFDKITEKNANLSPPLFGSDYALNHLQTVRKPRENMEARFRICYN